MSRQNANKFITGLVTVTLVTGQVPAVTLAEEAEPSPAGIAQGQVGPLAADEIPELNAPDSAAGSTQDGSDPAEAEQSGENASGNGQPTGAEGSVSPEPSAAQGEAGSPAGGESANADAPVRSDASLGNAGSSNLDASDVIDSGDDASLEKPAPNDKLAPEEPATSETPKSGAASDNAGASSATPTGSADPMTSEPQSVAEAGGQQAADGLPVTLSGQELRYHKGSLTRGDLYGFLTESFPWRNRFTLTYVNADGSDGEKLEGINSFYSSMSRNEPVTLADGTYRVRCGTQEGISGPVTWTEGGTVVLQSWVEASFSVSGCENGGAVVGGQLVTSADVDTGATLEFTVQQQDGYTVESVTAGGQALTPDAQGVYSLTLGEDATVSIHYATVASVTAISTSGKDVASVSVSGTDLVLGQATGVATGEATAVITPQDGYAITGVTLDGTPLDLPKSAFKHYVATVALGSLEQDTAHTLEMTAERVELKANQDVQVAVKGRDSSEYNRIVFSAALDADASMPSGLTADDVTVTYLAGGLFDTVWRALDDKPGEYVVKQHAFGSGEAGTTEQVRIAFAGDEQYPGAQVELTVTLADGRVGTHLALNSATSVRYDADEATMLAAVYNQLGVSVVDDETGKPLTGLTQDDFDLAFADGTGVGTHEVTVTYKGSETHKGCTATATVTVTKAPSSVSVVNKSLTYGDSVAPASLVSSTPSLNETLPLVITGGIDGDAHGYLSFDLAQVSPLVQDALNAAFGLDQGVSLADLSGMLHDESVLGSLRLALGQAGVEDPDTLIDALVSVVDTLGSLGLGSSTVALGGTPTRAGVYLVSAVTTSGNYETSVAAGYLTIAPRTEGVTLEWNQQVPSTGLSLDEASGFDFGATVFEDSEVVQAYVVTTYTGRTATGGDYFGSDAPTLPGTYEELATAVGGDYFATPISRTFTILQEQTHVVVEAGSLDYNGAPATVPAWIEDVSGTRIDVTPTVTYSGTTYDGQAYSSETAPTVPGDYTVRVVFAGTDVYAPCGAEAQLTISPRPIIVITYDADVVVSGDGDPANLYEYGWSDQDANTDWAGSEPEEDALGLTFTCAGAGAQVPGTYDVLAATAHPELFDVHLMAGCYTVLPRLTVGAEHGTVNVTGYDRMAADNVDYGVKKGSKLTLSAGQTEDGWKFSGWRVVSGDATIADASAAETTLTASQDNAVVEALYTQVEPAGPTDPGEPGDEPTDPDTPEGPTDPGKPGEPSDEPSTPSNPDTNARDKPATPQAPSADKPAAEKPAIPKTGDDTPDAAAPALAGGALALVAGALAALRRRLG